MMKKLFTPISTFVIIICSLLLESCSGGQSETTYQRKSGFIFGTQYNLTYKSNRDLGDVVMERLQQYDNSVSVYNPNSLMTQLNNGMEVEADSDLLAVIKLAKRFNKISNGAFDITVEPLSKLWRFSDEQKDDTISVEDWNKLLAKLDTIMPYVGVDKISIDGNTIRKSDQRIKLNANAIAEGYGIDLAAATLEQYGVTDYMVEIGGEIHCRGLNSRGQKWRIGIERPIEGSSFFDRKQKCIIQLTDCAVSTSGGYRQCWHVADGRKVQHTINPATGLPVTHNMESVTVVGKSTAVTDALCTTLMVAGPDHALELAEQFPNTEAYIIYLDEDGNEREGMTEGFRRLIVEGETK